MVITVQQYTIFKKIFQDVCQYNIQTIPETDNINLYSIKIESIKNSRSRFLAYIIVNNHLHDYLVDMRVFMEYTREPYDIEPDLSFVLIPGHVKEHWEEIKRLALNSYHGIFIDDKNDLDF